MEIKDVFAKNLKYLLRSRNITQTKLCEDLNVNKNTVVAWVKGTRLPKSETLQELTEYLGVTASELFSEYLTETSRLDDSYRTLVLFKDSPELLSFFSSASEDDLRLLKELLDHQLNE